MGDASSVSERDILNNPDQEFGARVLFAKLFPSSVLSSSDETRLDAGGYKSLNKFVLLKDDPAGQHLSLVASRLSQILNSWRLHSELAAAFQNLTEDQLADPRPPGHHLVLATLDPSPFSPDLSFHYVGRDRFTKLLEAIRQTGSFSAIQYGGPPGRGKSYVLAAMAGFLHVEAKMKVVYLLCSNLTLDPVNTLLDALLLAYADDATKQVEIAAASKSLEDLAKWCREKMRQQGKAVFLIDESNQLAPEKHKAVPTQAQRQFARSQIIIAARPHTTVWCASTRRTPPSSDLRTRAAARHLDLKFGDDPFTNEELSTWLGERSMGASGYTYRDMVFYTGLVPRLVDILVTFGVEECEHTLKAILCDFVEGLGKDAAELMERVLGGDRVPRSTIHLNREVLYASFDIMGQDASRVWCACGYLEKELRLQLSSMRDQDLMQRVHTWSASILVDANRENPVRMGWLAKGIALDCIQIQRSFNGTSFAHMREYHSLDVASAISGCLDEELDAGVLFLPEYDAKAVDAVLVKRNRHNVVEAQGIQITVAPWERKAEKDSHGYWSSSGYKEWRSWSASITSSFTYVLSDSMRAQGGLSGTQGVKVLRFGEIHRSLDFIDKINLTDPGEIHQCSGTKQGSNIRCSRINVMVGGGPYFCHQHIQASAASAAQPAASASQPPKKKTKKN